MSSMNFVAPLAKLFAVAALTALLLIAWQAQLIAPTQPSNTGFSSAKAFATLSHLLAEQRPHPTGSPENAIVRDRIVDALKAAGYTPEIQSAFQCSPPDRGAGCSTVENIIAVHKGTGAGKAILATAHYDSVPAGPGVADDGAGVAVMLELARHLATQPPARNDVIILIADSEETGLRGALAFAEHHPLMKQVGLVVNVEARGASGPSIMFETGAGNARLIDLFAGAADQPVSNSLAYEIYKLLPNDTDFSIYKRYNLTGFNFAIIGSASRYHSRLDDLAHLDKNSLQHHGDNTFALMAKLLDTDLATLKAETDASYFDIFGQTLAVWPAAINLPAALAALLGVVGLIIAQRAAFPWRAVAWSALGVVGTVAGLFALGCVLSYPLGVWPGVHPLDHPEPWPARIALAAAAILVALIAAVITKRAGSRVILLLNWLLLCLLAVACAAFLPGASYALVWPALIVVLMAWAETYFRPNAELVFTAAAGFAAVAFFWLAHFLAIEAVLGFNASHFKLLALVPFALALSPIFASSDLRSITPAILTCLLVAAVASVIALRTPAYSPDHPRPLNVIYYDDRTAKGPRWLIPSDLPPDEAFLKATEFPEEDEEFLQLGLLKGNGRFKPATNLGLPAPTLSVTTITTRGALTVLTGTLRSGRGGFVMGIAVAPDSGLKSLRIEGQEVFDAKRLGADTPALARLFGLGVRDVAIELTFDPKAPAKITLFERSALPDAQEARALTAARPLDAAPVHSGDGTLVALPVDLTTLTASP